MILPKRKIIGLLNLDYVHGDKILEIKYAGKVLFTALLGEKIVLNNILGQDAYPAWDHPEMPGYDDFVTTFRASNVLKWKNQEEILNRVLEESKRDPFTSQKKLFLSYDSCALRHRSNNVVWNFLLKNKPAVKGTKVYPGLVMAEGVKKELKGWDDKLKNTEELAKLVIGAQRFKGQLTRAARKLMIGSMEYRNMIKSNHATQIPSDERDDNIIQALKDFGTKHTVDLIVISEDANFAYKAEEEKISAPLIQHQKLPSKLECTWEEFTEWTYVASIIYGIIKIGKHHVYGIWSGKTPQNWYEQEIDVE